MRQPTTTLPLGPLSAAALALAGGLLALRLAPELPLELFARGAARLASLFLGAPGLRIDEGWALPFAAQPVLVTKACSATDFYLMAATVLGWHLMRRARGLAWLPVVSAAALLAALPLTLFVNALRIVAVAHAHHWVISRVPPAYEPFLHMLAGAGVFLPALIALNLLLELHGHPSATARA
ncbi:MAG: hypothetical protein RLZZ50_1036 [Verrucomicrobiota bacterium]|jgi:exosortase/archaeosortase family protein